MFPPKGVPIRRGTHPAGGAGLVGDGSEGGTPPAGYPSGAGAGWPAGCLAGWLRLLSRWRSALHGLWTWAPPSDKQREGGVLSTLLPQEPFDFSNFRFWHFRFSILTFSIFDFDMSILVARISIWDTFLYHSYAPDTSRYVFLLDFCLKCH